MAASHWKSALAVLAIWTVLFCPPSVSQQIQSQQVMASNLTTDLPPPGSNRFVFNTTAPDIPTFELVPLTQAIADLSEDAFAAFNASGDLVKITPDNLDTLSSHDIAYISCDDADYPGNLKASNVYTMAIEASPAPVGVILYSTSSDHCNYSTTSGMGFDMTFTTTNPMVAQAVAGRKQTNTTLAGLSGIFPDPAALHQTKGPTNFNGSSTPPSGPNGQPPTTQLAMVILYAITGIITGLFLVIIITGAIRAHRHPERYGPRNIMGRPRQSRARGIARAMLETIPIVKFGDPDPQPAKSSEDIEMAAPNNTTTANAEERNNSTGVTADHVESAEHEHNHDGADHEAASTSSAQHAHPPASRPDGTDENGSLGCSICTEDFSKGQEVRVLPCNHKFHPHCVDPWLLNVSGTCPLCRVNLNPDAETGTAADGTITATSNLPPPVQESAAADGAAGATAATSNRTSFRFNSTTTPQERLDAIRRLNSERSASQPQDRPRLSERLRERLRIRTRRQGDDAPSTAAANPSAPGGTSEVTEG